MVSRGHRQISARAVARAKSSANCLLVSNRGQEQGPSYGSRVSILKAVTGRFALAGNTTLHRKTKPADMEAVTF